MAAAPNGPVIVVLLSTKYCIAARAAADAIPINIFLLIANICYLSFSCVLFFLRDVQVI